MQRCPDNQEAATPPISPLKDPSSTHSLLALVAKRTHWAALCFRFAALTILVGAIFFDGLNFLAQAINMLAIICFISAALYVDEAAASAYRILERERQLESITGLVSAGKLRSLHGHTSAQKEIDEIATALRRVKRHPGETLAETVDTIITQRDQAWQALDDASNAQTKATNVKPAPSLRVVAGRGDV